MLSVVNNISALNASRQYGTVSKSQDKSIEKLSSGYKINRAADDAAGLTISEKMRSQIRGLSQGSDNIQDGISLCQIADGALDEVQTMLHRMTELSVKAANGTNTVADRAAIQSEIAELVCEIDRVAESTEFNTKKLFNGEESDSTYNNGSLTKLVTTDSKKGLTEAYLAANGRYLPSANLDFSNIDATNVSKIYNKGFSFVCGHGCGETFKFTFIDGDGTKSRRVSGSTYEVDIHGMTDGADIVNAIVDLAAAQRPKPEYSSSPITGATQIAHKQAIIGNGNILTVIDTIAQCGGPLGTSGYSTSDAAKRVYENATKGGAGSFDASQLEGETEILSQIKSFRIQCSGITDDYEIIKTRRMNAQVIGVDSLDVSSETGARSAIAVVDRALDIISSDRSEIGAYQNRLESSYRNNRNKEENTQAAESRIRDTDMAKEMVNSTKNTVLLQAGTAMMSQANQSTSNVLALLQ